jgi:hypothetical protein
VLVLPTFRSVRKLSIHLLPRWAVLKLGWVHDLSRGAISTAASLGGVSFTTATPRADADGAQLGIALGVRQTDDFNIRVEYDGDFRGNYTNNSGLIKASFSF